MMKSKLEIARFFFIRRLYCLNPPADMAEMISEVVHKEVIRALRDKTRDSSERTRLSVIRHQFGSSTGARRGQGCDLSFVPVQGVRS